MATKLSFNNWWHRFCYLAQRAGMKVGEQDQYREYYDDGDAPDDALMEELNQSYRALGVMNSMRPKVQ